MFPVPTPSSIAQLQARPAVTTRSSNVLAASVIAAPECNADPSLLPGIAGSALSSIKLSTCCGIAASLAGLGPGAAVLIAVGALTLGTTVCLVETLSAGRGHQLSPAIVQHGVCNDWHTLIGGLAGSTPTTMALTGLASALAVTAAEGPPRLGTNGLACLAAMVAVPAMLLVHKGMRAVAGEPAEHAVPLACLGVPMIAVGIALGLPTAMLHRLASSEAALRYVVGFGANMAGAAVREALTQTTLPAWRGIERTGAGLDYGLPEASGRERLASTVVPTLISCLLFAGSSALTLHYLEAATDLGMAPAGQALLSQSPSDIGRRSALRSLVLQSTNEMLEGLWRGLSLAGYAAVRGIALRYRNTEAGLADVPAAMHASGRDPATWDRTAIFASARILDGALPNLLAQLASMHGIAHYWNGFRIGAALAQGATMARTPILAAHVLPRMSGSASAAVVAAASQPETTDTGAASLSDSEQADASSTPTSIVVDSVDATEDASSSLPTPCADPGLAWA
jgi:hypothetical protein